MILSYFQEKAATRTVAAFFITVRTVLWQFIRNLVGWLLPNVDV